MQTKLDQLQRITKESDNDTDKLIGTITDIIGSAGDMTLRRKLSRRKRRRHIN